MVSNVREGDKAQIRHQATRSAVGCSRPRWNCRPVALVSSCKPFLSTQQLPRHNATLKCSNVLCTNAINCRCKRGMEACDHQTFLQVYSVSSCALTASSRSEIVGIMATLGLDFVKKCRFMSLSLPKSPLLLQATLLLEVTVLVVMVISTFARIPPASAANVLLAATFTLHYLCNVVSGAATPSGFKPRMIGRLLTNRVLVPFFVTVYSFAISRFGALPFLP